MKRYIIIFAALLGSGILCAKENQYAISPAIKVELKKLNPHGEQYVISDRYSIQMVDPAARPRYDQEAERREQLLALLQEQNKLLKDLLTRQLESFKEQLNPEQQVSDGIKMDVEPNVMLQKSDDGRDEMNLVLEFSYETRSPEEFHFTVSNATDDYPAGAYLPKYSKACQATLAFIKNKVDNELADYFVEGTEVSIKITGVTDGATIRSALPYKGEYGDFENRMVYFNDHLTDVSVNRRTGITTNGQLAFLRTQGVQDYLENSVVNLKKTINHYQLYTIEREETGAQYRKIAVEFTIHKAFNSQMGESAEVRSSMVDTDIPETSLDGANTYVLILANEMYSELIGRVPFAHHDGEIFAEYCRRTLGVPQSHIRTYQDATRNHFDDAMDWIRGIAAVAGAKSNFVIYYAGHGIPSNEESYLLPVDANPEKPAQMVMLKDMYSMLSDLPAQRVICLLDACFSGTRRNGEPIVQGGRGVNLITRPKQPIHGNLVVLSAADAKQTAYPKPEDNHGLFTYFLLRSLQQKAGTITLSELFDTISDGVRIEAAIQNREQTPCIQTSEELGDNWKNWTLGN